MKRRITIIAAVSALLLIAGAAWAQPGMMSSGPGRGQGMQGNRGGQGDFLQGMMPMLQHLDLSDEQRTDIRDIMETARDQMNELRESSERSGLREDLRELFTSSTVSASQIEALLDARLEMMEEANEITAEAIAAIHDVLTPEQLQRIADFEPGDMHGNSEGPGPMIHGGHMH